MRAVVRKLHREDAGAQMLEYVLLVSLIWIYVTRGS